MEYKVNLMRKCRVEGKWKLVPVAKIQDAKGERIDYTQVMVDGKAVPAADGGTFYLDYRDQGKRVRRAVGSHMREAKAAVETQGRVLGLRKSGIEIADAPQILKRSRVARLAQGKRIADVVSAFLAAPPVSLAAASVAKYSEALRRFAEWCPKRYVQELDRADIDGFMAWQVRVNGVDMGTAIDKAVIAKSVMNKAGGQVLMRKGDWPRVTERQPEIYKPEFLSRLFAAMGEEDRVLYQTFLMSGFRDAEVMHLCWDNFDAVQSTLGVRKKPGFNPKNYQERTNPIPAALCRLLVAYRARQVKRGVLEQSKLIFPTSAHNHGKGQPGGLPNGKMLDRLKRIGFEAGLNCGECIGSYRARPATCADRAICTKFGLHRFRHTYATTLLRDGVDLVSVQTLMGHKDILTTRKYLRALEPSDLLAKINATSLATRFVQAPAIIG